MLSRQSIDFRLYRTTENATGTTNPTKLSPFVTLVAENAAYAPSGASTTLPASEESIGYASQILISCRSQKSTIVSSCTYFCKRWRPPTLVVEAPPVFLVFLLRALAVYGRATTVVRPLKRAPP